MHDVLDHDEIYPDLEKLVIIRCIFVQIMSKVQGQSLHLLVCSPAHYHCSTLLQNLVNILTSSSNTNLNYSQIQNTLLHFENYTASIRK